MKNKILSICIPTFRGDECINDLFISLEAELLNSPELQVEVIVSDNNTDISISNKTRELGDKYLKNFDYKFIDNQNKDLRLDGNIDNLLKHAKGRFAWFISDDDSIKSGALKKIISILSDNNQNLGLIFINYEECDIKLVPKELQIRPKIFDTGVIKTGDEFIFKTQVLFGLLSSIVVDRKKAVKTNYLDAMGKDSVHIAIILELAARYHSYIISEKLVLMRTDNDRWGLGGEQITIISRLWSLFAEMQNLGYEASTIKYIRSYFFISACKTIIRSHINGRFDRSEVARNLRKFFGNGFTYYFCIIPLIYFPSIVFKYINKIRKVIL